MKILALASTGLALFTGCSNCNGPFSSIGPASLGYRGVFMQRGANDCGVAALMMIFDHFHIPADYDELLAQVGNAPAGASMLRLKELSEASGLRCEGWRLKFEDLNGVPLPAILFIRGNHFIVLDGFNAGGGILIRDPARGRLLFSPSRLKSVWRGEALLFSRAGLTGYAHIFIKWRCIEVASRSEMNLSFIISDWPFVIESSRLQDVSPDYS